jgi:hypothetical protein
MRCFGYVKGSPESDYPSELEEVTVAAEPATLRAMARFLDQASDLMEKYGNDFEHSHFEKFIPRPSGECRFVVNRAVDGSSASGEYGIGKKTRAPRSKRGRARSKRLTQARGVNASTESSSGKKMT